MSITSNYHGKLSWKGGPAYTGPRSRIAVVSGRRILALGGIAFFLGHGGEALTLAGVLALAGMVAALAGALALAGVGADAVSFAGGVGHGRHGGAGQEQGGRSGGNGSAGLRSHLHGSLLQRV